VNIGSVDRTTNNILSILVGSSVELSQCECDALCTEVVDLSSFP
jgi:hypothetical protein